MSGFQAEGSGIAAEPPSVYESYRETVKQESEAQKALEDMLSRRNNLLAEIAQMEATCANLAELRHSAWDVVSKTVEEVRNPPKEREKVAVPASATGR